MIFRLLHSKPTLCFRSLIKTTKWRMITHSKFSNLSNWKEAWKKSRLQRDSNPWPPRIPVRCSTNWAMRPQIGSEANLLGSYLPWGVKWCEVYIYIYSSHHIISLFTGDMNPIDLPWISPVRSEMMWCEVYIYTSHHFTPHGSTHVQYTRTVTIR